MFAHLRILEVAKKKLQELRSVPQTCTMPLQNVIGLVPFATSDAFDDPVTQGIGTSLRLAALEVEVDIQSCREEIPITRSSTVSFDQEQNVKFQPLIILMRKPVLIQQLNRGRMDDHEWICERR